MNTEQHWTTETAVGGGTKRDSGKPKNV